MLSRLEGVKEYSKTKETLETLVGMLAENKSIGNALWFDVLDIFLNEQRNVEMGTSGSYSKKVIISKLIKRLLSAMKGHVSLSEVLIKITKEHRQQPFREFRSTITSMLDNVKYESGILCTVRSILGSSNLKDLEQLHRLKCAAYTDVDFWDTPGMANGSNMTSADSYEEQRKETRKKMKRYRKRLKIRKRPLFEVSERSSFRGLKGNSGSSRSLLKLQPL